METSRQKGKDAYRASMSTVRCTRRKRARAATCIQAAYRGERTRNRVVQPALAAFRDVCDRISAECPGLTAESLCGPVSLPRWLITDRPATASSASALGTGFVGDGSADCTRGADDDDGATAAAAAAAAAAAVSTTLPGATAPRGEEAGAGSNESEELKRPPPHPATPSLSSVVASDCVPAPPRAVAAAEGRNTTEALEQKEEVGGEEEVEKEQEIANPNTARLENAGAVSDSGGAGRPGGSAQQVVEDSVERHTVDGSDKASVSCANKAKQEAFRDGRQQSMESSAGEGDTQPNLSVLPCSNGETMRPASCDTLPVGSNVVDMGSSNSLANRPTTDADIQQCFTYSEGEDSCVAATPKRGDVADGNVLLSPRPNVTSASPSAPPPRPTSLVVGAIASPLGDRAEGADGCNSRGPGDSGDASLHRQSQPLHFPASDGIIAISSSWKESDGGAEERDGNETAKREDSVSLAVGDVRERRGRIVDSRGEGDTIRKLARAVSRLDTAKAAAPVEREAREAREGEEQNLVGGGRGTGSADILTHAYAAYSSPTRGSFNLLGRGQTRGDDLGRSLTGSVYSSFDLSPLKGESISTPALAAVRNGSELGYSDGIGGDAGGVDLLAAAKAVVNGEGSLVSGAAGGKDLSRPFSTWFDDDRRPADSKATLGFPVDNIDRRASGSGSTHYSRRSEPTLAIAAPGADENQNRRFSEEEGCDGERAASIADWSTQELEEELCRIREAIESRVRYLLSIVRESGSAAV